MTTQIDMSLFYPDMSVEDFFARAYLHKDIIILERGNSPRRGKGKFLMHLIVLVYNLYTPSRCSEITLIDTLLRSGRIKIGRASCRERV